MNGIVARIGLEQLVLLFLALAAVLAVLADLGSEFWTGWLLAAVGGLVASQWQQRRLVTDVD